MPRLTTLFVFLLFTALPATVTVPVMASDEAPRVTMTTTLGDIVIELNPSRAPQTVENFLQYVDDGFYSETLFHRVIDGFMIQGGGFTRKYQKKPNRAPISNEAYNGLRNDRYTIAMARTTAPHSATSQFFINRADNGNLDHTSTTQRGWGYTVFGKVVEGKDVVDAIGQTRTSSGGPFSRDVPVEPVVILSVTRIVDNADEATKTDATATSATNANSDDNANDPAAKKLGVETAAETQLDSEPLQPVEQN